MNLNYREFHQLAERIAAQDSAFKAAYDKSGHDILGFIQYFMAVCQAEYVKQHGRSSGGCCGDANDLDVQAHMVHYFTEGKNAKPTDIPIQTLISFRLADLKEAGKKVTEKAEKADKPAAKRGRKAKAGNIVSMDPPVVAPVAIDNDDDDWGM